MAENEKINWNNFHPVNNVEQLTKKYDLDSYGFVADKIEAFSIDGGWVLETSHKESNALKSQKIPEGIEKLRKSDGDLLRVPLDWTEFW